MMPEPSRLPFFRRVFYICREKGIIYCFRRALNRILGGLYPCSTLYFTANLQEKSPIKPARPEVLSLTCLSTMADTSANELQAIFNEGIIRRGVVARNLRNGALFWIIRLDNRPVGYRFSACQGPAIRREFPFLPVQEDEAIVFGGETLPAYRGQGIAPAAIESMLDRLAQNGIKQAYVCCEKSNAASVRSLEKTRFQLLGKARMIRLFGRSWAFRRRPLT
jgi:GNAT superfamily N-acetyltransferase